MTTDQKTDAIYKAVLILLDVLSQDQRAKIAMRLVKQGTTYTDTRIKKPPIKKKIKPAS